MSADRKKSSFKEAEGKFPYAAILAWGEIDQRLRAALWNRFYFFLNENISYDRNNGRYQLVSLLNNILIREFVNRRHKFANEFTRFFQSRDEYIKKWSELFSKACPKELMNQIESALDVPYSPYRLLKVPPTIIPAIDNESAIALKADIEAVFGSRFAGAKTHLQTALSALNRGDHRDVVRESISSVESAVRDFTNDPKAILSTALKKLSDETGVHAALRLAFEKLYVYTNDEKGIRHALGLGDNEKIGFDEAIFFLSACSAFVAYLMRKTPPESSKAI